MHVLSQIKLSHSKNHAVPQSVLVNKEETWRAWNAGAKWTGIQVMTSFSRVNDHPWNSLVRDGQSTDAGRLALSAHVSGPAPFFNPPPLSTPHTEWVRRGGGPCLTRRHQQPASYGTVGAAQGGVGGTPEELLAKKGLDASGTLVSPPLTLMSLCSASAGRMRSAFSTGGSDGPSPRRCSLTTTVLPHHDGAPCPITSLLVGTEGAGFAFVCLATPHGLRDPLSCLYLLLVVQIWASWVGRRALLKP